MYFLFAALLTPKIPPIEEEIIYEAILIKLLIINCLPINIFIIRPKKITINEFNKPLIKPFSLQIIPDINPNIKKDNKPITNDIILKDSLFVFNKS